MIGVTEMTLLTVAVSFALLALVYIIQNLQATVLTTIGWNG